tara:strand:+ start:116 stop:394 length:279 start_codon:yes stop_codon:yes gene_type:complete
MTEEKISFEKLMIGLNEMGRQADFIKEGQMLVVKKNKVIKEYEYFLIDAETREEIGYPEWNYKICKFGEENKMARLLLIQFISWRGLRACGF